MPQLKVIQPAEDQTGGADGGDPTQPASRWKSVAKSTFLRLYRLAVIVAIVWMIHRHHVRLRIDGDAPIRVEEVRPFFPAAARLEADDSPRGGLFVLDKQGNRLGYAVRTSPAADRIVGWAGSTDTLVALSPDMNVIGIKVRSSQDTKEHVADVVGNDYFMGTWNGKSWDFVTTMDPHGYRDVVRGEEREVQIEGASGASLTSLAIANGIRHRFSVSTQAAAAMPRPRFGWHDAGLAAVIVLAAVFTFTHLRSRPWLRRGFQAVLIGYVGFVNGQILAQSLLAGWATSSVPWRTAPGLVLLAAAALVVPWSTRRQLYCSHVCPHGAAQEWMGRLTRKRLHVPRGVERGLRWLPPLLVALVLFVTMLNVPFDLAGIEPFDAYVLKTVTRTLATAAGVATVAIAAAGLVAAVFVPMAYCKYGCPTGLVLSFVRSHGKADGFGRRDAAAGLLVAMVAGMYWWHEPIRRWLIG